jgi:hypothetical protein
VGFIYGALVDKLYLGVDDVGLYLQFIFGALVHMLVMGVDLPHPSQACKPVHHKGTVDKTHDGFYLRCLGLHA